MTPPFDLFVNGLVDNEAVNLLQSRKRSCEDGAKDFDLNNKLRNMSSLLPLAAQFNHQQNNNPIIYNPQQSCTLAPIAAPGLRLYMDNITIDGNIPDGNINSSSDEFHLLYSKQREEIDQLIKVQGERMRQALEERRQRHTRTLLTLVEECLLVTVKERDAELERVRLRNLELEERVKQLRLEAQLWQSMARNNEAMVWSLRSNLEQVMVAQSREQISKEGWGDSAAAAAAPAALSCINGQPGHGNHHHDAAMAVMEENKDLTKLLNCRACRSREACILLLPCRHIFLCKECDAYISYCHICGSSRNASVQVYLD